MKTFHRPTMLPLAACLATAFLTACASNPMGTTADLAAPAAALPAPMQNVGETRDWAAIDTDKDNLISAAEMAAYLDASRKTAAKP